MNTMKTDVDRSPLPEEMDVKIKKTVFGGSVLEIIAGAAAFVLAIVGLAGRDPFYMLTIATICAGAALLFMGGTVAARYANVLGDVRDPAKIKQHPELWSGMSAEFLGGFAGIVMGVLAFLNVRPFLLTAVAAIVFGAALILGSGMASRLNYLLIRNSSLSPVAEDAAIGMVRAEIDVEVFIGLAGITLGILAIVGVNPMNLTMVAMLCIGAAVVIHGAAVGGRLAVAHSYEHSR